MVWRDVPDAVDGVILEADHATDPDWNADVKANGELLKTDIRDDGTHEAQLKGVGFSSGVGNTDAGETDATGFEFTLPADFLNETGDALYMELTLAVKNNANTKILKFYVGATAVTIRSAADNTLNLNWLVRVKLIRRKNDSGALNGSVFRAVAAADGTLSYVNLGVASVDWTASQACKFTLQGGVTDDLKLAEMNIDHIRRGNSSGI